MTFTSLSYVMFLPTVFVTFYFTKEHSRWIVLLLASYCFYATFKAPQLIIILALVTIISYFCGIKLSMTTDEIKRKYIFWFGTISCVLILVSIKYLPAIITLFNIQLEQPFSNLIISIGVSYFTFQAISYLIDIYLEVQDPERHFGYHALFIAFFPKLLQGPIERAHDLLPQLKMPIVINSEDIRSAGFLFIWGLFKKVVLANHLALYTDNVYNNVYDWKGLPLLVATYAYALQIFFDFSGYTDMARGTARLFGINLTENFNSPYLATSIADFWRRWHISFSRWILDYIFKPLQFAWRDQARLGTALALIVTFLVSGIWHGTSWGFIIWGLLHGIFLATSTFYRPYQKKLYRLLNVEKKSWLKVWQIFVTFNLVCFTWIFFRANSLKDSAYVIKSIFLDIKFTTYQIYTAITPFTINNNSISHCIIMMFLLLYYIYNKYYNPKMSIYNLSIIITCIVFFGKFTTGNFIYMNF